MDVGFESYFHGIYNRNKKRLMSEAWKLTDLQEMKTRCWLKKFHLLWQKENFGYATEISNHFSLKRFQGKMWIFSCLSFFNLISLLYFPYVLHFQSKCEGLNSILTDDHNLSELSTCTYQMFHAWPYQTLYMCIECILILEKRQRILLNWTIQQTFSFSLSQPNLTSNRKRKKLNEIFHHSTKFSSHLIEGSQIEMSWFTYKSIYSFWHSLISQEW